MTQQVHLFWLGKDGASVKNPSANAGDARDVSLIPGSGRSSGVGNGNPLQYSFLAWKIPWTEEPGELESIVRGVPKSHTHTHTHTHFKSFAACSQIFPLYGYWERIHNSMQTIFQKMGAQKVSHSSIASLVTVLENIGKLGLKPKHLSKTQI